jgi:hypothetical protein
MDSAVRPAFSEIVTAFDRSRRGRMAVYVLSLDQRQRTGQHRGQPAGNPIDSAWAQMTISDAQGPEFVYRLELTVSPRHIQLRKRVTDPEARGRSADLVEGEFDSDLGHGEVQQLTREEVIRDFLQDYSQRLDHLVP